MMQMYFLSIVMNVFAGLILISKKQSNEIVDKSEKRSLVEDMNKSITESKLFQNKSVNLMVGILTFAVGVIKFFCVAKGGIIILGDLLPAVTGITAGFAILLNYYLSTAVTETNLPPILKLIFVDNIYLVGIASCGVALLHFIMPGVIFF